MIKRALAITTISTVEDLMFLLEPMELSLPVTVMGKPAVLVHIASDDGVHFDLRPETEDC